MNSEIELRARACLRASLLAIVVSGALALSACGGDGGSGSSSTGGTGAGGGNPIPPANVSIHATVTGLLGQGLVLQNSLGDDLGIATNGQFTFGKPIPAGTAYSVTVKTQPTGPNQLCTVNDGNGTASETGANRVAVTCSTVSVNIRGTVSGLTGLGLVLQNNAGDDLAITGDGTFAFATPVARGAGYTVTVKTPPAFPIQQCTVSAASGTAADVDIKDVAVSCATRTSRYAYVGNVSGGAISTFAADASTGTLAATGSVITPFPSPFVLAVDPSRKFLYTGNSNGASGGGIAVYNIDAGTGTLAQAAGSPYLTGDSVQAVVPHPGGGFVYALNLSGSVSAFSVDGGTGALIPVPGSPFAAGFSPRSMVIDPAGKRAFVSASGSGQIFVYDISPAGALVPVAGSPFAVAGTYTLVMSHDGKYLYVSLPGADQIGVYAVDPDTGALTLASAAAGGPGPRGMALHGTGRYLYVSNQGANSLSAYRVDASTGALTPIATVPTGVQPIGLALEVTGSFLYAANSSSTSVSVYRIDSLTGAPVDLGGAAPYAPSPFNIAFY